MSAPILQFKRGNAGVAGTVPALRPGEPAISLNNFDFYIGIDTSVQNNKFFGSHRYWGREDGTNSLTLKLVDKDGSNSINLKAPNTLAGSATYTFPATPVAGRYLSVAADGTLSWEDAGASGGTFSNATLTGITSITGTLNVSAESNFTGIATFSNVDINDGTIDGVVIGGITPDEGYFTLVDTDVLVSDNSTIGIATATDFYIDSTRVLYDDGLVTLAGIQTIDATTKATLEGILALDPNDFDSLNVAGIATIGGLLDAKDGLNVDGHTELDSLNVSVAATFASATVSDLTSGRVVLAGVGGELQDSANLTFNGTELTVGTGVGITQFSSSVSTGTSTSSVPTSSAVIDYVSQGIGAIDLTLGIDADTGGPSTVDTSQTLTIAGTANEIKTSVSGQTITVGLTTDVTVSNDLTVQGNLYVNGSTTQVNTNTLTVQDRTIELGIVQTGQPTTTTWDLAVLFNYGDGTAKKAGVVWEASGATKRFQFTTDVNPGSDGGPTDTNLPAFTVANFAPIEISELWVNNSCTGGAQQVISCVNSELALQNIVVDAGTF